jgi:hypothetical protein
MPTTTKRLANEFVVLEDAARIRVLRKDGTFEVFRFEQCSNGGPDHYEFFTDKEKTHRRLFYWFM